MNSFIIPKLSAARAPKTVAMPRLRRSAKPRMSLTEVVHRILVRANTSEHPFAAFAIDGRLIISNMNTDRFKALQRRSPKSFIATYGPGIKVADALEDLREHFSDEDVNVVA
jgi:hypothetical protein